MTERFCPNCGEVFEPGVDTCADCGSALADGPAPVQLPPGYVEYAFLGNAATLAEAYVVRTALAADGIPVRIEQEFALTQAMGGLPMPAGGYALSIPVDVADDALQALKTIHENRQPDKEPEDAKELLEQRLHRCLMCGLLLCCIRFGGPVVLVWSLRFWPDLLAGRIRGIQKAGLVFVTLFALANTLFIIAVLVYHAYALGLSAPYAF